MSLVFLKLGGSLITDKNHPYTARLDKIEELAGQVAAALKKEADLHLLLGHGSGSFGHTAASQFDTRRGVHGPEAWGGFAEVWYQASALDRLVVEAFHEAGLPVVAFPAAASVTAHDGKVFIWDSYPLQTALANGLVPVVYGDVAFDEVRNGTILSTEELFAHLARQLQPQRILLAGQEAGIWADFPARKALIAEITPEILPQQAAHLGGAAGTDVTGGMQSKVAEMMALVEEVPGLEVLVFSGEEPGAVQRALQGENLGTRLHR